MNTVAFKHSFVFELTRVNVYHADAGEGLPKHVHNYAHATVCYAGRLAVRKEGFYEEMTKDSQPVLLREDEWHELEAIEDGTVFSNIFKEGAN